MLKSFYFYCYSQDIGHAQKCTQHHKLIEVLKKINIQEEVLGPIMFVLGKKMLLGLIPPCILCPIGLQLTTPQAHIQVTFSMEASVSRNLYVNRQ